MGEASTSALSPVSDVCSQTLPAQCENCFLNFTEWIHVYYGQFENNIQFCQNHGMILKECKCPSCGNFARLDFNQNAWRCDRSVAKGKKTSHACLLR